MKLSAMICTRLLSLTCNNDKKQIKTKQLLHFTVSHDTQHDIRPPLRADSKRYEDPHALKDMRAFNSTIKTDFI